MPKINLHIEIVSSDVESLSSMGLDSRRAAQAVLSRHYTRVGITIVNDLADLDALVAARPDLVLLGMKFVPQNPALGREDPNKIWLSGYLEQHGIAHTGSGQAAHQLELQKPLAKQCVAAAGVITSKFYVARQDRQLTEAEVCLDYPLFVKPTNRGGGSGIDSNSVVHNYSQLRAKILSIHANQQADALVEEYLSGREFSVAILKDEYTGVYTAMALELIAPQDARGQRLLSDEVKLSNAEVVSGVADDANRASIFALAIDAFHALGGRDYGRIDIRLNAAGEPHFLEANLIPSLIAGYGSFPKSCLLNAGLSHEEMLLCIVRLGMRRISSLKAVEDMTPAIIPALDLALVPPLAV